VITSEAWAGKRYAVLGLARSGAATVRALVASGAEVVAWDSDADKREALVDSVTELSNQIEGNVTLEIADPETIDLAGFDALVVSPGVPLNRHPVAEKARRAGVPIIGDIELFAQARAGLPAHKVVGVTGTNGKSTTVSLIHHILQTAGIASRLGGNIGLPILEQEPLPEGGVYVLELSSYQIDLTQTLDCDVAVLLNITPDHLDRYEGFAGYAASKQRLFEMQSDLHHAVIAEDDNEADEVVYRLEHEFLRWKNVIRFHRDSMSRRQSAWLGLRGPHNAQNSAAAIAVCEALGVDITAVEVGLRSYSGLRHRMERVATRNGVEFVNDSKATNPESTAPALAAFERVHWILGGQSKSDDLDACAPSFGHVVRAYTIGAAGPKFAEILKAHMPVEQSGTLENAVTSAAAQAKAGETVLLSPACASFDQFRDFEDRGDQFRHAVEALA
jgi:UDP-N-acetylmuramoylalanine--D-glutamate ligase